MSSPVTDNVAAIRVVDGNFSWRVDQPCLKNISLTIPYAPLTVAAGSVASGKFTFCMVLLGEVPRSGGHIVMGCEVGKIGDCFRIPVWRTTLSMTA